jgi:Uma2 family endonuclease
MSAAALPRMTADEFIAWAMEQPEGCHYELVAGEVHAMAPQRSLHALTSFRVARRLAEAVEAAGAPCTVYADGMSVEIDSATVYEPDAMVRCGAAIADDAIEVTDPLILVEVMSPSSRSRDATVKFVDYFRIPSLRHYLIVLADIRTVIHHARDEAGLIQTRIVRDDPVQLDPPGITLDGIFPTEPGR